MISDIDADILIIAVTIYQQLPKEKHTRASPHKNANQITKRNIPTLNEFLSAQMMDAFETEIDLP